MNRLDNYNKQLLDEELLFKQRNTYAGKRVLLSTSELTWRNINQIARRAGCTIATARKHLDKFIFNKVVILCESPSYICTKKNYYKLNLKVTKNE